VNLLIFMPVGVFGFLALRQNFRTSVAAIVTLLFALVLSSSIEMIQLFDDGRECTASEVVLNVSGTAAGIVLGRLYQQWLKRLLARTETSKLLHPSGAILLSYTWLAYQAFPLFPLLSRARLPAKLRAIFAAISVSPLETFTYFAEWLVAAQLLENVLGRERTYRWFPLLLIVPPVKVFIVGRTFTWSELTGAGLAYVCSYSLSRFQWRRAVVAGLMVSLLIVRGLVPYQWSRAANPFSWIPFSGFLMAERGSDMLELLEKSFWYGSAVWLLRATGWRLVRAAAAVALLLGAIEVIEVHIPGRVAEITDPLLALILAVTLGLLDRPQNPLNNSSSAPAVGLHG
jgi:VanZ family protein